MTKHKWHDEIVAWAGGAEIEALKAGIWFTTDYPAWDGGEYQFRIKPQPKQPKYLYAYIFNGTAMLTETKAGAASGGWYIGKIEVQDD
jgi:hypothetical protein